MAIRITEDGVVNYENSPDVNRKLFPNLNVCGKEIAELEDEINGKAPTVFSTTSGSIASFDNGADDMPLKSCVVTIEPIQEGEGDPSPENVRPISGRTGLSLARCGKNLLDKSTYKFLSDSNIVWGAVANNTLADGSLMLEAGTYVFSCSARANGIYIANQTQNILTKYGATAITFTLSQKTPIKIMIYKSDSSSSELLGMNYQLEIGSTATDYEPYKENTYTVNWETEAGTVYDGTLDVVSGKLTVDHAKSVLNGSETWAGDSNEWYTPKHDMARLSDYTSSIKSDRLKTVRVASTSNEDWHITGYTKNSSYPNQNWIYVKLTTDISTSQELKNWLSENPVEYIYPLAVPTEIQLTPQEIRTLLGENNIWADMGDVSVDYPADTKTYIDDLSIKTVEVTGQAPTITAEENTRYICGEVTSLSFTPCEKGICDVRFTAASISTVLTLPETVKLPEWFDPTLLEANTTYEINIVDGVYGVVMSWA